MSGTCHRRRGELADAVVALFVDQAEQASGRLSAARGRIAAAQDRLAVADDYGVPTVDRSGRGERVRNAAGGVAGRACTAVAAAHRPPQRRAAQRRPDRGADGGADRYWAAVAARRRRLLLLLPALTFDDAVKLAHQVQGGFAEASRHNPFLPVSADVVVTVSRERPLPVQRLREALVWAEASGVPVAQLDGP